MVGAAQASAACKRHARVHTQAGGQRRAHASNTWLRISCLLAASPRATPPLGTSDVCPPPPPFPAQSAVHLRPAPPMGYYSTTDAAHARPARAREARRCPAPARSSRDGEQRARGDRNHTRGALQEQARRLTGNRGLQPGQAAAEFYSSLIECGCARQCSRVASARRPRTAPRAAGARPPPTAPRVASAAPARQASPPSLCAGRPSRPRARCCAVTAVTAVLNVGLTLPGCDHRSHAPPPAPRSAPAPTARHSASRWRCRAGSPLPERAPDSAPALCPCSSRCWRRALV